MDVRITWELVKLDQEERLREADAWRRSRAALPAGDRRGLRDRIAAFVSPTPTAAPACTTCAA